MLMDISLSSGAIFGLDTWAKTAKISPVVQVPGGPNWEVGPGMEALEIVGDDKSWPEGSPGEKAISLNRGINDAPV